MKINKSELPIFSGTVIGVPAVMNLKGVDYTVIDYMSPQDELTDEDRRDAMPLGPLSFIVKEHRDKMLEIQRERTQRAIVPLRVDPSIIQGAEIRTKVGELTVGEYGEGHVGKTYELEIIKGRSQSGDDVLASLAEMGGTPHTGMKYIRFLEE